ncbi:deoxyribonuclease-2-alpha isoform X2 [Lepisosteus oculatus]|uniref:deoxyribonuclease-2-alpha isoform X2 n=1 Tax=Lepisosteus oculatus TaxID=7918 RepID=UPI0035F50912
MRSAVLFGLVQFLCLSAGGALAAVSCYNDQGSPVDWFYLYKLPQLSHHAPGSGLLYLLLQQGNDSWVKGASLVNKSDGALGRTVGQLYKLRQEDLGYILYNDQKPPERGGGGVSSECGHTKGVVLLDKTQGFWLVHSTPHFPPRQEVGEFSYPSTGVENGQNFLCMTFPLERFEAIGEQLQYNQPLVFDCSVPDALASQAPSLHQLCRRPYGAPPAPRPANRSVSLPSLGGTTFLSFAKSRAFDDDLYVAWVAPSLGADLLVQFWQRSAGVRPSNCSLGYRVLNVEGLDPGGAGPFRSTLDHSKWAASAGAGPGDEEGWVCVGDINRDEAEERRGGGTVCQRDGRVWRAYHAAVTGVQDCP